MRRYRHRVTFQAPTEVRDDAGGVDYTYENVEDLTDLPALVVALTEERRGERQVVLRDLFQVIVSGDRDIEPEMAALYEDGVLDVLRVAPIIGKRSTLVTAERVAI